MDYVLIAVAIATVVLALILNVIAFSFWSGKISQKLDNLCDGMGYVRIDVTNIYDRVNGLNKRVSHIEGKLE